MPRSTRHEHGESLERMALSATLHCLTGCAIGEVAGVIIGTALGLVERGHDRPRDRARVPVRLLADEPAAAARRAGARRRRPDRARVGHALDRDHGVVDNAIMLVIPGAMDAGLDDVLFWGSLSFALFVAGFFAYPVNRWLLQRGKGHAAVHATASTAVRPARGRRDRRGGGDLRGGRAGRRRARVGP